MLIKDEKAYKYSGARDEKSLTDFIFKSYEKFEVQEIPNDLPTFFENLSNLFSEFVSEVINIYKSGNTTAIAILSFLFGLIFVLILAITYFSCFDPCASPKRTSLKRSTQRDSKRETHVSTKRDSKEKSGEGEEKVTRESVKKRSKRREE